MMFQLRGEDTDKGTASMNNDGNQLSIRSPAVGLAASPSLLCLFLFVRDSSGCGPLNFHVLSVLIHLGSPPLARLFSHYKQVSKSAVDYNSRRDEWKYGC